MKTGIEVSHSLLRFLTCGSVDDGKSTLIGRLLYDSRLIMDDTLATIAIAANTARWGRILTLHCWWMGLRQNASKASP